MLKKPKPRVLLIEDSVALGDMLQTWFQLYEYPHEIAMNGAIALRMLHEAATSDKLFPQVIILDINMPEIDGCTFIEEARRIYPDPVIPIIVYTASVDAQQEGRLRRANAERILYKARTPVEQLLAAVDLLGSPASPA